VRRVDGFIKSPKGLAYVKELVTVELTKKLKQREKDIEFLTGWHQETCEQGSEDCEVCAFIEDEESES
jgi:hypothetical protein